MNTIHKITIFLIISLISQIHVIESLPNNIGGRGGVNKIGGINKGPTGIGGITGPAHKINNQAAGAAAIARNNNQPLTNNSPAESITPQQNNQSESSSVQETESNALPIVNQQNDAIPAEPTTTIDNQNIPNIPTPPAINPLSTNPIEQQINPIKEAAKQASLTPTEENKQIEIIEQDKKAEIPDQATILKTLQAIDAQSTQNHMLLTQSSMDQLFNNFIYFKNFIVENFTKEKMLQLCIEFIDQIYPKGTVVAPNIIQETSLTQRKSQDTSSDDTTDNNENESDNPMDSTFNQYQYTPDNTTESDQSYQDMNNDNQNTDDAQDINQGYDQYTDENQEYDEE